MKAYRVNVNGNVYEITLEVIDKADIKAACPDPKDVVNGANTFTIVENKDKTLTINKVTGTNKE